MKKYLHYTKEKNWTLKEETGVEHAAHLNDAEAEEAIRAEAIKTKVKKSESSPFDFDLYFPELDNLCADFEAVIDEVGKGIDDMLEDLTFLDDLEI